MSNNKLETVIFVVKKAKSYFSYTGSGPCLFEKRKIQREVRKML
jgi:hypothetical protein